MIFFYDRKFLNGELSNEKSNALKDITWCLEQLKRLETHNSVSEMTIDKFRKVLYEKQMSSECDVAQQVFEFLKSYDNDIDRKNQNLLLSIIADFFFLLSIG